MKRNDWYFLGIILFVIAIFAFLSPVRDFYLQFNREHGMVMSFIKFAVLATLGEVIALRVTKGVYNEAGFGILPRMLVWGILGLAINMSFQIFSTGAPAFLAYMGLTEAPQAMQQGVTPLKLLDAIVISTTMNTIFGPVMMTIHKITDIHILRTGGSLKRFLSPINMADVMQNMNWSVMWNFVYKKTIPFFWIPAHTITFLLPPEFRVLFAALLGVALGLILAFAKSK